MSDMQRCGIDEVLGAIRANENISVLLVKRDTKTTELEEVLSLSDRIVVMFDGNIVGEKINKDVTDRELGLLMAGVA